MLSKSQVKYIQSLGHKKFRDEEAVFIAEGPKIVKELITEIPALIKNIYAVKDWIQDNQNSINKTEYTVIEEADLERISQLTAPNKVLAVVNKISGNDIDTKGKITLALDTIQDPGNMGTIIRTADWFSIDNIICSDDTVDAYNPKVVQASMGSLSRVNVHYVNITEALLHIDLPVFGAMLDGENIYKTQFGTEGLIVMGNEGNGLRPGVEQLINKAVTIPRLGKAESLNVGIATALFCAEISRNKLGSQ